MYTCQICKKAVPPNTKAFRIPVEFRKSIYPERKNVFLVRRNHKEKPVDDPGGVGQEIAREVTACPQCFAAMNESDS